MCIIELKQREQITRQQRANAGFVSNFKRQLTTLRNSTINFILQNMTGNINTLVENTSALVREPYLSDFYSQMYGAVGGVWAGNVFNQLRGIPPSPLTDAIWQSNIDMWVRANTGAKIVSVEGTLKNWVRARMRDYVRIAIQEGTPIETLVQNGRRFLENAYTGYGPAKIRQIVAHEVLSAASVTQEIGAESAGLPFTRTWIHSGAQDPHVNHVAIDGVTIQQGELFQVGAYRARYPRDLSLGPEESIGCMCTVAYRLA